MGASCDRSREQFTLSEQCSRAVRKSFTNLYHAGNIYQGEYITNRCPASQTVVSDIEIEYEETKGKMYYIRYFIDTKSDSIIIATTRPETMFADVAIAVNPLDKKYKKMIGKKVLIPIINKAIPVIADEYVDMHFGT
jgi:valyl-tRNA synthetase